MTSAPDSLFLDLQAALAGRYSLLAELGRGGMGVVYLAREVRLDRLVALKVLPPDRAIPALRERFLREARTAAKLSQPNIIPIHAVDEIGKFVFFAMAYVDGESLSARIARRGPMEAGEASRLDDPDRSVAAQGRFRERNQHQRRPQGRRSGGRRG
jgi:serine/threonine-protein kinase